MRNILKPAARTASSRTRRSLRGIAAVVASVALAAGLGSYPVDAQETSAEPTASATAETVASTTAAETPTSSRASSAAPKPVVVEPNSVTVERDGDVDHITIRDTDDNPWDSGRKASDEYIWGVKRIGDGDITRIVKVVADGEELDPQYFGYVNGEDFDVIGIDEDAFWAIPPMKLEIEVETTEAGEYAIAEPDEVPTARELSETGYGRTDEAAATVNPDGVGMARAASQSNSRISLALNPKTYSNISEPSGDTAPRGTLKTSIGGQYAARDVYLTELVLTHNNSAARYSLSGPITIRKNGGTESCTVQPYQITELNRRSAANGGSVNSISVDLSGCDPQVVVWQGSGDKIDVDFNGPKTGNAQSDYTMELYGSYNKADQPTATTSAPSSQPQPSTSSRPLDDDTKRFAMEGRGGIRLTPAETTGESPYETTATVEGNSTFSKAAVRISAPNSILATEGYTFNLDKTETGVSFERRVVSTSSDYVEFEVYPVKNGQRVDSVQVPDGAKFTMTSRFSDNPKSIDAVATIHGTSLVEPKEPVKVSPPDGADWVEKQYPNPEMPKKCGLKVAIVADQSRSLNYGDENGFKSTRDATTAMVEALRSAPGTEVGLYTFGRTATSSTGGPVPLEVNGQLNPTITNAIDGWTTAKNGDATNWEAALNAVMGQSYDVVYFITDGMPTFDEDGWQNKGGTPAGDPYDYAGAFVQERSLNRAILAANKLKEAGTRIVPIQVDLTLRAGNVVTRDYVLKNIYSFSSGAPVSGKTLVSIQNQAFNPSTGEVYYPNFEKAVYKGTDIVVNVEQAINATHKSNSNFHLFDIVEKGNRSKIHTTDQKKWTHGTREVKQMGEDISGPGDTVHIENYSALAAQLETIAQEVARLCHGKIIVQKEIVDANGKVLTDGAEGWEFSVMANGPIIDAGNDDLVYADSKTTANEEGADKPQASWNLVTDNPATATITEHQQEGYKLYQRDDKNAVCTQNLNGKESPLEVQNTGATGFRVPVNTSGSHVATVVCVVANTKADQPNFGLEVKKVDLDDRNTTLSEAQFEVREVAAAEGEAPQAWKLEPGTEAGTHTLDTVLEPGKEYDLVEVKAPSQDGVVYSLLTAPVRFRGTVQDQGVAVEYESDGKWVSDISTQGVWSVSSDKQTAYLEVANVRQGNMPKTGGVGVQLPILLGGALIAAGALMGRRKVTA